MPRRWQYRSLLLLFQCYWIAATTAFLLRPGLHGYTSVSYRYPNKTARFFSQPQPQRQPQPPYGTSIPRHIARPYRTPGTFAAGRTRRLRPHDATPNNDDDAINGDIMNANDNNSTLQSPLQQQQQPPLPLPAAKKKKQKVPLDLPDASGVTHYIIGGTKETRSVEPQVFAQRWIQLAYISVLALMSDWLCFSVAAVPQVYEHAFAGQSAATLIDIFLFTNVASCFVVTDIVAKVGLQKAIQGAAVLMTAGCWLRSGISFWPLGATTTTTPHLMPYPLLVAGTVLVGAAQPFFQCTPPFLSATWFAPNERATSTAIAINFNQIGIATAFLVGGAMATTVRGLATYFGLISVLCTVVAVGCLLQFQNEPPIPPSASELEKKLKGETEPPFLESVQYFFKTRGFTQAFAAFVASISITNLVGAFIEEVLERGGVTNQLSIDLAGAGFELAILVGGILIGGYVDRTKQYKRVTMACLAATAFFVIPLGLTEHAIGKEPILLIASLLGLGMAAGPVQPINAELAVDVTYPGDETAVESVQQIGGNLISALLVPVAELAARQDFQLLPRMPALASDVRGDVLLLLLIALATLQYFSSFDAPLARTEADTSDDDDGEEGNRRTIQVSPEVIADKLGNAALEEIERAAATGSEAPSAP